MRSVFHALVVGAAVIAAPQVAFAAGDADKGKRVFNRCKACHVVNKEQNRVGPYLKGVVGRKAGVADGYKYSKLNQAAGAAGLVWTEENLMDYLVDPTKYLKAYIKENGDAAQAKGRSKMIYKLRKEDDRADVIAYLKTFSEAATN